MYTVDEDFRVEPSITDRRMNFQELPACLTIHGYRIHNRSGLFTSM